MRAPRCDERCLPVEPTQTAVKGTVDDPTDELRVDREREIRTVPAGAAPLEQVFLAHVGDVQSQ
jgi:hypothetical protein